MIPITKVVIPEAAHELVGEVLRSGSLAQGAMVERFEAACAAMAGTDHAIAVGNGTVAIVAMLHAAGIGPGDEVITTPATFAATLNAILEVGATAVFGDIDDHFNLDPQSLPELLTERTAAVLPVHLYGQCADIEGIAAAVADHTNSIFEDAAQAHGATRNGKEAGGLGTAGTFSFYATKNLFCGEGGCITTNDDTLAARLRVLRNQGMRNRYEYLEPGYNWRLTDLAAAVAVPQFETLPALLASRQANADFYATHLSEFSQLRLPFAAAGNVHAWHQYTIELREQEGTISRDSLVAALNDAGVGAAVYYPRPVYAYDCYFDHPRVRVSNAPRAEQATASVFSIPIHQHLQKEELQRVVDVIGELM